MFDPLDLYTPRISKNLVSEDENYECNQLENSNVCVGNEHERFNGCDDDDDDNNDNDNDASLMDILDLPSIRYASSEAILCVLLLLKPDVQVNFCSEDRDDEMSVLGICEQKDVSETLLKALLEYYTKVLKNSRLNTYLKICNKIPTLNNSPKDLLLNYYTSVLKCYEGSQLPHSIEEEIIKQVSLRISENCGRTAQPAISRKFTFQNLSSPIEIHEPSLTADNLGWKTWGSSFILSQKLIDLINTLDFSSISRVLELGSGTGLAGISWLSKCLELNGKINFEMFLTDLPEIVPNLQKNVEINSLREYASVGVLDWTAPANFSDSKFDIIIISDPIYSPNHPQLVVDMIAQFLSSQGRCYLEIPIRDKYAKERELLWTLLRERGLEITDQKLDQGLEDWGMVNYLYQEIFWNK